MRKFTALFLCAALAFTVCASATGCGDKGNSDGNGSSESTLTQVKLTVAETATTVCGSDYTVPAPTVTGTTEFETEISVSAKDGSTVSYNEETGTFYAKNLGADAYTITYTVTYTEAGQTRTLTAKTKITTTDGEKPTISAPDYVTGIRGEKVEIPTATVTDNSGETIVATYEVIDDQETVVTPVKEDGKEYIVVGETQKWYTVIYHASDSGKNEATPHECKIWIRNSQNEVEYFDTAELVDVTTESSAYSIVGAEEAPQGGSGKVLKLDVPALNEENSGYVSLTVKNLGVTDFTNVTKLKMKAYSTAALSNYSGWHAGNAIVAGKADGATVGKSLPKEAWTEIVWNRAEVQEMFNGQTAGKYTRPVLEDVTELRFDIDNAGWWGTAETTEEGHDAKWNSQSFTLYIDSIEVEQMDVNWVPKTYETDTAKVYEINTFNDEAHFEILNFMDSDMENVKVSLSDAHAIAFDSSAPETENKSLKVEVNFYANGYPRFLVSLDKLEKLLGFSSLPDGAKFLLDVYCESGTRTLEGNNNIVFYEKGNSTEKKPDLLDYMWVENGNSMTLSTSVLKMKDKGIDLANLNSVGFYFNADATWDGDKTVTVYFDNFRLEVPKGNA